MAATRPRILGRQDGRLAQVLDRIAQRRHSGSVNSIVIGEDQCCHPTILTQHANGYQVSTHLAGTCLPSMFPIHDNYCDNIVPLVDISRSCHVLHLPVPDGRPTTGASATPIRQESGNTTRLRRNSALTRQLRPRICYLLPEACVLI